MIGYLTKSSLCLIVLLIVYRTFLEQEKMHRFNRYFLIFGLIFSLTIPLLTIELPAPTISSAQLSNQVDRLTNPPTYQTPVLPNPTNNAIVPQDQTEVSITPYLFMAYLLISSVLLLRFLQNLYSLAVKVYRNERVPFQSATLVLVSGGKVPHSFLSYIFVNKQMYRDGAIDETIFTHELTHVRQKHSLDILFIELLKVAFWFNPAVYFFKKAIQLNHEFLADETVVSGTRNVSAYQRLLLKIQTNEKDMQLTSSINYSITKKRIIMMTKKSTTHRTVCKQLAIIPLLAALVFAFSTQTTAAQNVESMSLIELMEVINQKIESVESLSGEEKKELNSLVFKIKQKLNPRVRPPRPFLNSKEQKTMLTATQEGYRLHVKFYSNITPVEGNRDKLEASYEKVMILYNEIDKLEQKIAPKNPPPPKPLSPTERIERNSEKPQPPIKTDTTQLKQERYKDALNFLFKEHSRVLQEYLEISPVDTDRNRKSLEILYEMITTVRDQYTETLSKYKKTSENPVSFRPLPSIPQNPTERIKTHAKNSSNVIQLPAYEKNRNLLRILVNEAGLILMDEELVPLEKVKAKVKEFITNNNADPDLSESPQKARIHLKTAKKTPHKVYTEMLEKIQEAYLEIRNTKTQAEYGVDYQKLIESSPSKTKIQEMYPVQISIADPEGE